MAIAFRGSATGSGSNGANFAVTLSGISGLAEGDLVIVAFAMGENINVNMRALVTSPGWTYVTDLYSDDTQDTNLAVYAKFMGATPDASVTLTGTSILTTANSAVAMAFSGVDRTRPFDVTPTTATGIDTVLANPPAIIPVTTGAAVVAIGGGGHLNGSAVTYGGPANYTTNFVTLAANDTNDSVVGMGYNLSPTIGGGGEDPGAFTYSTTDSVNYSWAAVSIALRPSNPTGIYLVGQASGSAINGGDVTLTLPTCLENDLVIVATNVAAISDLDISMTTSGYTEVADLYSNDSADVNLGVFYKKMGAVPDTTAVTTGGGADSERGVSAVALVFRTVDTATPMDVAATTSSGNSNSSLPDPPSIDYSDSNAVVVCAVANAYISATSPTGYVFPLNYWGVDSRGDDTRTSVVGLAYKANLLSDPEDPPVVTPNSGTAGTSGATNDTAHSQASVTMALRKAAAGGGATGFRTVWLVGI